MRRDPAGSRRVAALTARLLEDAGVGPAVPTPAGVEVVRRHGTRACYLFVLNHTADPASVPVAGTELLDVSDMTVRRDLDALARHLGAVPALTLVTNSIRVAAVVPPEPAARGAARRAVSANPAATTFA